MAGDSLVTRRGFVTTTGGVVDGTSLLGVASAIDLAARPTIATMRITAAATSQD